MNETIYLPHALRPPSDQTSTEHAADFGQVRRAIELGLRLGEPQAARQATEALRRQWPDAIAPVVLLGQSMLDAGDPAAALVHFYRVLKLHPLDALAWAGLAGALGSSGRQREGAVALRCAALHDPLGSTGLAPGVVEPPQPHGLGVIYLRRGHAELAVAELAAALDRQPERADLRLYYAETLRRQHRLADARAQLDLVGPSFQASFPALLLRAALATDPQQAAAAMAQCARYDPDGHLARRLCAPERPPWELPPAPAVQWVAELESIARYLSLLPQQRALASKAVLAEPVAPPRGDPDVASFVATTERLRRRLTQVAGAPEPLVPAGSRRSSTQVLLGCRSALSQRYGEDGFTAIDARLRALAAALSQRGLATRVCYLDDAASLRIDDRIALAPVAREAPAICDLVRDMAAAFREQDRELATLVLVGGDESIPFHRLPNPVPDDDAAVLSDNPYASDDAGYLIPQRVVARLPESADRNAALLPLILDQMLDVHEGRAPATDGHNLLWAARSKRVRSVGYSAAVWQDNSRAVLDVVDPAAPLHGSPPLDADTLDLTALDKCRLLYLNLHGAAGLPNWYGQGEGIGSGSATRLPIALRPEQITGRMVGGGVLVSEACYGLDLDGRGPANSIPLRALAEGALACVGATSSAYGSFSMPLLSSDLLCERLLAHLNRGVTIGMALHYARLEFAQIMYRRQGFLDDVDMKTLMQFVLVGDPWARIVRPSATSRDWNVAKLAAIERLPKPRLKAALTEDRVPRPLVRRAREILGQILPGAVAAPLRITAQIESDRARKSDANQSVVFSAQERWLTVDGHQVGQTAHVTLRGEAVVKVVLTR